MTVQEFLDFFNGIYCDYDGAYGDQCFDLANGYSRWIGGPRFTGETADLIINQAGTFYTRIDNAPDNFPQKGDIVVWSWPHVGIATGDNTSANGGFDCLEQNDPTGSDCHLKHYNTYNGVLGWLRPNNLPQDNSQAIIDELRTARDANWNLYQDELKKNNDLTTKLQEEQTKEQNLRDAFDLQTKADANTGAQLLDVSHERDELRNTLAWLGQLLGTTDTSRDTLSKAIVELQKPVDEQVKPLVKHTLTLQEALDDFITNKKYKSWIDKLWEIF